MAAIHVPSPNDRVVVVADFSRCRPDEVFTYWIQPGLLRQWWGPDAEIDARPGGSYHIAWPAWHLRGCYTTIDPGKALAFTWQWDHNPAPRNVVLAFEPLDPQGTRMTITHSAYTDAVEDQEDRISHINGWTHFAGRLQTLLEHI